jgi:hypothetical protein
MMKKDEQYGNASNAIEGGYTNFLVFIIHSTLTIIVGELRLEAT